ncbi:VC0807 family protein [Actinokineospora bangkokensis]|uniref:DUF3159 domain-containing protein n=1 Tax=Actinokineospora bangkokensis TaxID=1193682 RepID=A0A1Q9LNB8_9PSEU|nr:VC0807 family protein [Actinokineospora bangkokensis]OLR93547.1 hypothetical protein BJP25_14720 [Actinokineospora bangkokensis]
MRRLAAAVAENVALPVAVYLLLGWVGWQPVWALVGASAASVLVLAARYLRTGEVAALGVLVLARFAVGVAVAVVTGDARLELAKDSAVTGVVGVVAAVSLLLRRPLIARIRRDLAEDRELFDRRWRELPGFRALHRGLTLVWTVGLVGEAALAVVLIYSLPLTAAVVATSVLSPAVLAGLIGWTEVSARRWTARHAAAPAPRS